MTNSRKVFSNLIWRFLERCGSQLVSLVVSIVLARLLAPELYGLVAKVTVITSILLVFVDGGMANALIQKKDPDDLDFSSVFWFNVSFCLIIYALLYFCAPLISRFYSDDRLIPLVRALGLIVVVSGVKNVQQAYVAKTLQFKKFFFSTLSGTILSGVVGLLLAFKGYGVWALVAQQLVSVTTHTIVLWCTVRWRPKKLFSVERLKSLLAYGWKLLVSELLDTAYNKLREVIIAVRYTDSDLAFYNRGNSLSALLIENVISAMNSVLVPVMSSEQDQKERVRLMTAKALKTGSFIIMPMMMGLAVCAEPFVRLVLTEKWLPCVPYLRVFCAVYAFWPMFCANLDAIKAMGRSDIFLYLEIIKKAAGVSLLLIAMKYGVFAIALSLLVMAVVEIIANSFPNRKLIGYPCLAQLRDILPVILAACIMGAAVFTVTFLGLGDFVTLVIQVLLGVGLYIGLARLLKIDTLDYLLDVIKKLLHKEKPEAGPSAEEPRS